MRAPEPLTSLPLGLPLAARVFTLVIAFVICFVLAGCAGPAVAQREDREQCHRASEGEIAALFDRWNASLQTGDPHQVVANYATRSILLPTVSNRPRLTPAEKEEYFQHFLQNRPSGKIDLRFVDIACDTAVDAGLYTFTFGTTGQVVQARYTFTYRWEPGPSGGKWLISSHHSSAMPEQTPH
jgi:uncharacterized protein (TIGR02246 family)